jgi:S1-C subfamily serine protease
MYVRRLKMQSRKLKRLLGLGILISAFFLTGCGVTDVLLAQNTGTGPDVEPPVVVDEPSTSPEESSRISDVEIEANDPTPVTRTATLTAIQDALADIYSQVNPSIVSVQVQKAGLGQPSPFGEMPNQDGVGSGFIWDQTGHIVTNHHVVEDADGIQVRFYDGFIVDAEIVGTDPDSDLAVIKVDAESGRLVPVSIVDSGSLRVGDLAVAIGSPFGLENTMTVGFISAVGRSLPSGASRYTIPRIIQTDAAINPGNSGGALVNDQGEVIGVNTAIVSPSQASAGIGFAIPSSLVMEIVPVLIDEGRYTHSWLGISGTTLTNTIADDIGLTSDRQGVLIQQVVPDGPADQAGLRGGRTENIEAPLPIGGDLIVSLEGNPIRDFEDLVSELAGYPAGETVNLGIIRDQEEIAVSVTLGERPEGTSVQQERAQIEPAPEESPSAWMGIAGRDVTDAINDRMALPQDQRGVLIESVAPDSPAEEAGLKGGQDRTLIEGSPVILGGDVIVSWNGQPIEDFEDLKQALQKAAPGDDVEIGILRDGEAETLQLTLGTN